MLALGLVYDKCQYFSINIYSMYECMEPQKYVDKLSHVLWGLSLNQLYGMGRKFAIGSQIVICGQVSNEQNCPVKDVLYNYYTFRDLITYPLLPHPPMISHPNTQYLKLSSPYCTPQVKKNGLSSKHQSPLHSERRPVNTHKHACRSTIF